MTRDRGHLGSAPVDKLPKLPTGPAPGSKPHSAIPYCSDQTDPLAKAILNADDCIGCLDNVIAAQLSKQIPDDDLDFWADEPGEGRERGDGWASISADINLTELAAAIATHVAEAIRAAFPTEYGVRSTGHTGKPVRTRVSCGREDAEGEVERRRINTERGYQQSPAIVVARPVIPWHPIKETP